MVSHESHGGHSSMVHTMVQMAYFSSPVPHGELGVFQK